MPFHLSVWGLKIQFVLIALLFLTILRAKKKAKDPKKDGKDKAKEGEVVPIEEPVRDPVKEQELLLMQR